MLFKAFVGSLVLWYGYQFLAHGQWGTSSSAARQSQIRQAMLDSWHHYENHGYGYDEFHPVAETGKNMGQKPLGWMVVDSLDTLMIMGADEEVARARKWVRDDLNYHFNYEVNTFETTIRMLGGLIAAFDISGDDVYLDRAVDLANALMGAFESPSGLPYASVNLETGEGVMNHVDMGASSTAEVATLQLELKYLAKLTGETMFWEKAERVMAVLDANKPEDGLVPIYVHPETGKFQGKLIRLGSRGDSYYEYLLKQYLQTQKQEKVYWDMYRESVAGVKKHLVGSSYPSGLTFIGELEQGIGGPRTPKMDHLVCFYGGLLAVGATGGLPLAEAKKQSWWTPELAGDFKLGEDLTYSCVRMYQDMATGLSPEIVMFNEDSDKKSDLWVKPRDKHNLQRPETVESLFYLWRLTGEQKYRDWGWQIFENFVKYTKVTNAQGEVGFSSIDDVTSTRPSLRDNTESFWWAETLKYLYLLFDDTNMFPLDQYVFNTEAHPFKTFDMGDKLKTGWSRKIPSDREPQMPKPVKPIDKNKPPKAQPVDKSPAQEAEEEIKKNPELAKDHR